MDVPPDFEISDRKEKTKLIAIFSDKLIALIINVGSQPFLQKFLMPKTVIPKKLNFHRIILPTITASEYFFQQIHYYPE